MDGFTIRPIRPGVPASVRPFGEPSDLSCVARFDGRASKGQPLACADAVEAQLPGDAHDALTLAAMVRVANSPGLRSVVVSGPCSLMTASRTGSEMALLLASATALAILY